MNLWSERYTRTWRCARTTLSGRFFSSLSVNASSRCFRCYFSISSTSEAPPSQACLPSQSSTFWPALNQWLWRSHLSNRSSGQATPHRQSSTQRSQTGAGSCAGPTGGVRITFTLSSSVVPNGANVCTSAMCCAPIQNSQIATHFSRPSLRSNTAPIERRIHVRKQNSYFRWRETHNMALNLAPFGRWTLRDKAAQRRLVLR